MRLWETCERNVPSFEYDCVWTCVLDVAVGDVATVPRAAKLVERILIAVVVGRRLSAVVRLLVRCCCFLSECYYCRVCM